MRKFRHSEVSIQVCCQSCEKSGRMEIYAAVQSDDNLEILLGQGFVTYTTTGTGKDEDFLKLLLD